MFIHTGTQHTVSTDIKYIKAHGINQKKNKLYCCSTAEFHTEKNIYVVLLKELFSVRDKKKVLICFLSMALYSLS